jgi:hypothetical protein
VLLGLATAEYLALSSADAADRLDDAVRARLLAQRAVALCESGRLDEALPDSQRAVELAEHSGNPELVAEVLPARHLAVAGPEWSRGAVQSGRPRPRAGPLGGRANPRAVAPGLAHRRVLGAW